MRYRLLRTRQADLHPPEGTPAQEPESGTVWVYDKFQVRNLKKSDIISPVPTPIVRMVVAFDDAGRLPHSTVLFC